MKTKTLVLLLVAGGCGLVAAFMTKSFLSAQQGGPPPVEQEVPVLVAKESVPGYTLLLDANLFEVRNLRKADVSKDAAGDFDKIKGRTLRIPLTAGKPLAESDLLAPGQAGIIPKLKPGERAMTVKVTPVTGTDGFILPGDKVDVVATQIRHSVGEQPYAKIILQDIEVLAIDQKIQTPDNKGSQQADHVTVRLTPEQVEILSVYADTGTLRLTPRRPDDIKIVSTSGAVPGKTRGQADEVAASGLRPRPIEVPPLPDRPIAAPIVPDLPAKTVKSAKRHVMTVINGDQIVHHEFSVDDSSGDKAAGR